MKANLGPDLAAELGATEVAGRSLIRQAYLDCLASPPRRPLRKESWLPVPLIRSERWGKSRCHVRNSPRH